MLTIRKEQLLALETAMRREWAHAAVAELSETHPYVLAGLHPAEIRARLEIAAGKSNGYGFDLPETVRAYVRLSFLIGPHFDVHPSFRSVLTSNNSGLARMFR